MSNPRPAQLAKLVVGLFTSEKSLLIPVAEELSANFGAIDLMGAWFPFAFTTYYKPEMGFPLYRRMMAFRQLIEQPRAVEIKLATNTMEQTYTQNGKRHVNIDPGYLLYERFVLMTGKNYTHRIYVDKGIYADLTLIYQQGAFQPLPWTYPDYAQRQMLAFLKQVRNKYVIDVKGDHNPT